MSWCLPPSSTTNPQKQQQLKRAVQAVFTCYDSNKNGTLQTSQVLQLINDALKQMKLSSLFNAETLQNFIKEVDLDGDGCISRGELLEVFKKIADGGVRGLKIF